MKTFRLLKRLYRRGGSPNMGQEAAMEEMAKNKSFNCAHVKVGDSAIYYRAVNRKSARWRGPALIPDIEETAVTAKFQSKTFKVARRCVRRRLDPKDVGEVNGNPAAENSGILDGTPSVA